VTLSTLAGRQQQMGLLTSGNGIKGNAGMIER
jgi:hypothetical protein